MAKDSIFSPEHKKFMTDGYLRQCLMPAVLTTMINEKFGTRYRPAQVRRWVNANLTMRRKAVQLIAAPLEEKTNVQIARDISNNHKKVMERWVSKSERAADKAFTIIDGARDARTLSSAASAAATLIKTYRVCAGIDGADTQSKGAMTFNLNFASVEKPVKLANRECSDSIEVDRIAAPAVQTG